MSKIIIYGLSPSVFESESELLDYMREDLFTINKGRFRFTQSKEADIVVVSFGGKIFGYLTVKERVEPGDEDKRQFSGSKKVYLINQSKVCQIRNKASDFGLTNIQFGKTVPEETFEDIKSKCGNIETFPKT